MNNRTIMLYRGALITDEPYQNEPFTIIIADRIWDHSDEETLEEILDTIDVILDESKMEVEPMPEWRVKETERRIEKIKARNADITEQREKLAEALIKIDELTAEVEKGGASA